ncbi:hypothetical protein [Burkholderia sp. Bp9142]|uniref:hypothetical protein n=1 Tax=Burkholderia sp. Bp9142 TaxID=2184573 RepID=UPI000F59A363|nr:hypothetical protein [Burkholderia sp. Bp9142]
MQEVRGVYHKQTAWSVYILKRRCYDRLPRRPWPQRGSFTDRPSARERRLWQGFPADDRHRNTLSRPEFMEHFRPTNKPPIRFF